MTQYLGIGLFFFSFFDQHTDIGIIGITYTGTHKTACTGKHLGQYQLIHFQYRHQY